MASVGMRPPASAVNDLPPVFQPVSYADLPGWREDAPRGAFEAFRRSAIHARQKPYRAGSLGIQCRHFAGAYEAALEWDPVDEGGARAFFETWFLPCRILAEDGGSGFVTGFYEPEAAASPIRTARYQVPLYARPEDLVEIDDTNRPAGFDPYLAFGRRTASGIVEYHDREAIETGALGDKAAAIAWLARPVDAFFIHVQGAARLSMTDGSVKRVTYAAKSGQRFTGPGHVLADLGEIARQDVTMQSIRAWFVENPHRINEILWRNRSYIFFRETALGDAESGPIAAAKVQLHAGRSLAVDRLLHTFGTPFFIDAPSLTAFDGEPFRRLMIAQDTGSAIVGPARGDIFAGTGEHAGEIAGVIRHSADFYALLPREFAESRR